MQSSLLVVLGVLGLTCGVPLPQHPNSHDKSIPRYMLRLYQEITQGINAGKCGYKTVRNLKDLGKPVTCQEYQLKFNLSSIPNDDENILQAARIHLELTKDLTDWHEAALFTRSSFRLHLGHGPNKGRVIQCENEPQLGIRDIIFNVTEIVHKSQENRPEYLNLTLIIDGEPPLPACPPNTIKFEAMMEIETSSLKQINCNENGEEDDSTRRKRSTRSGGNNAKIPSGVCQRFPLAINFREIGWDNWVVAPATYNAYFCSGTCPFPINDHLNASNHAVVQNLVHSFQPNYVPPACCAPTKLAPMSMLYYEYNSSLILKTYEDMVVDECGCQ
uniref:TGF-beta family profile domain-containing protein n=1 Tax=Strigamia maritima TaxID=126957 RepID=T1J7E5_STRMM